jgi:hypothetical protein
MLSKLAALPEDLGELEILLADNGYFSAANVAACTAAGIEPLIAAGRQPHHPSLRERFAAAPPAPDNPTPVEAMIHRLQTAEGKKLPDYARSSASLRRWYGMGGVRTAAYPSRGIMAARS